MATIMRRQRRRRRVERVVLPRPRLNEEFNDVDFFTRYRFRQATVYFIVNVLGGLLEPQNNRNSPLSGFLKVCVTLRYLSGAGFQQIVADSLDISLSTVCRAIWQVIGLLCAPFTIQRFVRMPGPARKREIQQGFHTIAGFPNVVGCVDGTFIPIMKPAGETHEYINRKGYASLNVQMICDHQYRVIDFVAKWPGSTHDSRVFRNSNIGIAFANGEQSGILLGDSGYPCRPYLLTPFLHPVDNFQMNYNNAHMKTRVRIEQTFGIMKRRFSILQTPIRTTPFRACRITSSCIVLHNIGIDMHDIIPEDPVAIDFNQEDHVHHAELVDMVEVRNHIATGYFR